MQITVSHNFLPKQKSARASVVMDHFGIDFEQGEHTIADNLELPIEAGDVVLFTGESGAGKSSLMKATLQQIRNRHENVQRTSSPSRSFDGQDVRLTEVMSGLSLSDNNARVVNLDDLELGDKILIDTLPTELKTSLSLLSACGLGEAQLMLRTPAELSDGQRYRFRLALALAQDCDWIVADEFTATLDRTLAKVIAHNIHKLSNHKNIGFLLATTHCDVADDLAPDLHVHCELDGTITVERHNVESGKKKDSPSPATSGSAPRPSPIGRTSLGGITARITSD